MNKKFVIKKREQVNTFWNIISFILAITIAFLMIAIMLAATGQSVIDTFVALLRGAFGGKSQFFETLVYATPFIFTGLATVIAFRAHIWSIGQEGQLILGSICAYIASSVFGNLPFYLLLPTVMFFGFLGGSILGGLCGWLKSRFSVSEIISTVMFNYVAYYLLTYLLSGPLMSPDSYYLQTKLINEASTLPILIEGSRLHAGLIIALVSTAVVSFILNKTPLGYDIEAFGQNPTAMIFKGTNVTKMFLITMIISGGLAGLAGASEIFGVHGRVNTDIAAGMGFTGITVALVGRLTPVGTLLAAILFGGLVNGGFEMQVLTGVPNPIVKVMQAIILLLFLCSSLIVRYQIKIVDRNCE